jgi:hypothetical protein
VGFGGVPRARIIMADGLQKMIVIMGRGIMSKQGTIGNVAVTCFILVQLLDWLATYQGLTLFGTSIEANP